MQFNAGMKPRFLLSCVLCLAASGCSLITVPVKTAGSIVTTTVSTTGRVVAAPFEAAGRNNASKQAGEEVQTTRVVGQKPQRRTTPEYE
ncbi:MAG: hypothetical protein B7Z37_05090 [Verrucomicrobia bacterium 12-59-8]|nr:MAG: hypothetical protein B7Z37_05090 [Verrucomicrobia bacterium 12-59-8]